MTEQQIDADRRFGPRATAVIREWTGAHPAEDRERLRKLADAATEGPWTPCTEGWATISSGPDSVIHAYHPRDCCHECGEPYDMEPGVAIGVEDLEFIAAARTAVPRLLDQLDRAEHRIARLEAQTSIRGRAVVMYRNRAREAEAERDEWRQTALDERGAALDLIDQVKIRDARIKAVQDLIDQADTAGDWAITCSRLQWAIDGTTPNPYRASETA